MRILFIGCVVYSKVILEHLLNENYEIVGVLTKDDTGFNADYFDISSIALKNNIPFLKTKNVNEEHILSWVKSLNADVTYCFGWNSLIGSDFISLIPRGVIGYHPASLPQNRGRHPIIWALVLGLKETASTFFMIGEGADDGDIVSQNKIPILEEDSSATLYDKLIESSKSQVIMFTNQLIDNSLVPIKQDHSASNVWRKRSKVDGKIDFRMSSRSIYNLVRALTKPYPGATVVSDGNEFVVWKVSIAETSLVNLEPGKVLAANENKYLVKCGLSTDAVLIEEHDFSNNISVGSYFI
ncbi:methionyl-tRNA formyltransferase [Leptospira perdikensis]|uniref:Formyl transferase n=1 Tax=Leptospira perdikensis TaxID=2484948 RepID=A0A4R9JK27_9LEPT|nr:formyltransferase family protein [Leptospira perdikensis]TGL45829.1 formyl transferase [Leptospira perdikensis]